MGGFTGICIYMYAYIYTCIYGPFSFPHVLALVWAAIKGFRLLVLPCMLRLLPGMSFHKFIHQATLSGFLFFMLGGLSGIQPPIGSSRGLG